MLLFVCFTVVLIHLHGIALMGKRKRSVALIESDSDEDSNSGADIDAVIANALLRLLLEIENETVLVGIYLFIHSFRLQHCDIYSYVRRFK